MSMRKIAIAGATLALALGCERQTAEDTTYEPETEQSAEGTRFEQAPERQQQQGQMGQQRQPGQQAQQPGQAQQQPGQQAQQQGQMGQQQQGQQGMGGQQAGQVVSMQSQQSFERTLSQLTREMRQQDLEVVGQIRYDEQTRQRALRELQQGGEQAGQQTAQQRQQQQRQQQQAQRQQQGGTTGGQQQIGDVRVILFRHTNNEAQMIENQGPEALLQAPRELLVYERGQNVHIAYRTPQQQQAAGTEEPTAEVLSRVVRNVTQQSGQRAEAQQQQQERQQAQAEQQQQQEDQRQARVEREQGMTEN